MNSKIRMKTNPPGSNKVPVVITCNHGVEWEEAHAAGRQPDANAAPPHHGIEIAPGGVLYMCCSWCAAHLQVKALKSLLDRGVQVTLTPPPPVKPPMLFCDGRSDPREKSALEVEVEKAHAEWNWSRCGNHYSGPGTKNDLKRCIRPVGHEGDHRYD